MKILKTLQYCSFITVFAVSCTNNIDNGSDATIEFKKEVVASGSSVAKAKITVHPKTDENLGVECFLMDLIDPETDKIIGLLQDCVSNDVFNYGGIIISRVITTINLYGRGSITSENMVLKEPTSNPAIFSTSFKSTKNNIIDGTFEFENITGTVALNGEIDLEFSESGIVIFNSAFSIDAIIY